MEPETPTQEKAPYEAPALQKREPVKEIVKGGLPGILLSNGTTVYPPIV